MSFTVRELADPDWDAVAAITGVYEKEGYTGQHLREMNARVDPADPMLRLVAEMDAAIVGVGRSSRRASDPVGKFTAKVHVAPNALRLGVGRDLAQRAEDYARANGGDFVDTFIGDLCERGIAFVRTRGYEPVQHLFESNLALDGIDLTWQMAHKRKLEQEGYSFLTLAEAGDTDENRRRIYALDVTADQDTPGFENWGARSYEQYSLDEHQSHGFTPDGMFIAAFQGEWVAMNAVRPTPVAGKMHTDFTGVTRDHRGKGIAQVLKALGIEYARSLGMQVVNTHNDERNAVMLAINRKFGFIPEPGFVVYRKVLRR
jgi:mycothiol synthase